MGAVFLVLAFALPAEQVLGLIGTSAVAVGLVVARLRRQAVETQPAVARMGVKR